MLDLKHGEANPYNDLSCILLTLMMSEAADIESIIPERPAENCQPRFLSTASQIRTLPTSPRSCDLDRR